jgi:hypothetical protein
MGGDMMVGLVRYFRVERCQSHSFQAIASFFASENPQNNKVWSYYSAREVYGQKPENKKLYMKKLCP